MLDAKRFHERQLLLQGRDRLRAVGGVEDTPRMRLEGDEGRLRAICLGRGAGATDDINGTKMHAVEAADGDGRGSDRARREPQMDLQVSTFSGTNVLRSGSRWPSATRRPPAS